MILCFWGLNDADTVSELDLFHEFYKLYGQEAHFVMVHRSTAESKENAMAFLARKQYPFPVYFDTLGSAARAYKVDNLLTTYFLNAEGRLIARATGKLEPANLPKVLDAIKNHFKPEVLNRIGNNIIVYDFIREEASRAIVKGQVKKINARIQKQNKIDVLVDDECLDYFFRLAAEPVVLEMGGRGIGNLMEEKYINPLAEFIFEANCTENSRVSARIENDMLTFVKEV
jgi:hypothetical protein